MEITAKLRKKWEQRNRQRDKKVGDKPGANHCLTGCFKRIERDNE